MGIPIARRTARSTAAIRDGLSAAPSDGRFGVPQRRARCYDGAMMRGVGGFAMLVAAAAVGGCSTNILHGIDERSANEATAALERAGIGAEKLPDEGAAGGGAGYTIRVARADSTRSV